MNEGGDPQLFVAIFAYALGKDPRAPEIVKEEIAAGLDAQWPCFRTLARARGLRHPLVLSVNHGSLIAQGRSLAIGDFLASGAPAMLSIDDDVEASARDLAQLVDAKDVDVLVAPCALRTDRGATTRLNVVTENAASDTPTRRLADGQRVFPIESGGVALSLVTRRAAEHLYRQYASLRFTHHLDGRQGLGVFLERVEAGRWWGEDYAFSRRVRESGLRLEALCDTAVCHAGVTATVAPSVLRPIESDA